MKRGISILAAVLMVILVLASGASTFNASAAQPSQGNVAQQPGSKFTVKAAEKFSESRPLRDIPPQVPQGEQALRVIHSDLPLPETLSSGGKVNDTVLQKTTGSIAAPSPIANFEGMINLNGFVPPDTTGDVGRTHYVQMVNSMFQIFSKSGTSLYGPANINTLFTGLGGACEAENAGDPIVVYDSLADRWLLSQFTSAGPTYFICYALSTSPDPLGSYYRYAFSSNVPTDFPDYFKVGVWPDAYYVTDNAFAGGAAFAGVDVCGLERDRMLRGDPTARQQCIRIPPGPGVRTTLPSDIDGVAPPPNSPNYLVALNDTERGDPADQLVIRTFKVNFDGVPLLLGPFFVPVASFDSIFTCSSRECVPQPPPAPRVDVGSDRVRGTRIPYRRIGNTESLLVNHTIDIGSDVAGLRWYELRDPNNTRTLFQQGTYAPNNDNRTYPAIAMDQVGNIGVGYTAVSATRFASVVYTGRLVTDPINTLQAETTLIEGTGAQLSTGAAARWGDYSSMVVDPVDECTFWYTQQYYRTSGLRNWRTRIGSFKFDNCTAQGTPTPAATSTGTPPTATRTATATPCVSGVNFTGSITTTDPIMIGRVSRAHPPSTCAAPITCALTAGDTFERRYDTHTYTNNTGAQQCVTVTVDNMCPDTTLASTAYLNSYDPNNLCTNYLADWGNLGGPNYSYSFNLPAGQSAVIVIYDLSGNVGCPNYNVLVSAGGACATGTPAATMTATAQATATATLATTGTATTATATIAATNTPVPPTATATPCTIQFRDVPSNHTFYPFIQCLACRGIISGYADGTFRPDNLVTRSQLAKIVSNAAGFTEDPGAQIFQDVPSSNPFYEWINRLTRRGIMTGYTCGSPGEPCVQNRPYFRPFADATRAQTSKIVSNAAGFQEAPTGQMFEDVPPTHPFYEWIQRLASRGVMGGYNCGGPGEPCINNRPYFRPYNSVTRGQSAKIVSNTFFPDCRTPSTIFGVTTSNRLVKFHSFTPGSVISAVNISGLQLGETVLGIDFRPANRRLYALGSSNRLYTVDTSTGAATQVGASTFMTPLLGIEFGFDFNPAVDRIRIVSDLDQDLRAHPDTGAIVAVDGTLAYAAGDPNAGQNPNVVGAGYTNSFAGTSTTTLYDIDSNLDVLVTQNPPNAGTLNTVGPLGVNASSVVGFDIVTVGTPSGPSNAGLAAIRLEGETTSRLYMINLSTGAATLVEPIGGGEAIRGFAVAP